MGNLKYGRAFLSHSSMDKALVGKIAKAMGDKCVYAKRALQRIYKITDEKVKAEKNKVLI